MSRPDYREAIKMAGIMTHLAAFDPHAAGTPPLGLALAASDIDILCHAGDAQAFGAAVWRHFSHYPEFSLRQWRSADRPVVASFFAFGWAFELFGQAKPVREQEGWRHFDIERRLLELGGEAFRADIMVARRQNLKTEPAFASVLGLPGDPYAALLDLERLPASRLLQLLAKAGYSAVA
jgi:hypothetical protein